jgi:hypothetical protein
MARDASMIVRNVPGGRCTVTFPREGDPGSVVSEFYDGRVSGFYPPMDKPDFLGAARQFGYGDRADWFGVDHDAAHHFLALALRWPFSRVVWADAHNARPQGWGREWPYRPWDEEHLVTRLQEYVMTGHVDEIVGAVWGNRLPRVGAHLIAWLRPWIAPPAFDLPEPLDPERVGRPLG